ncbi:hypothetical protein GIB67_009309 [Kingdonia uniflora]|uniref:Uncharacterized protein n=1 Tax=Kingdonia uniflora TaxID=39325 RepID=A0A7J7N328_9MAGN|nr:hypothetical protein GIB67_009309 [Kingdonia uniflora]
MYFSDDEPNIESEGRIGLGEDAPVNTEIDSRVGLGGEIKDMPIHKLLEKLNIMLMKLMYDMRLKSKEYEKIAYKPRKPFSTSPLVRGARRSRKQRIIDPYEEKRHKRYGKYRGYGHNKKTCKGVPATPRPRLARAPKRVDTNVSMSRHMSSVGLPPATPNIRGRGSGGIGGGGGRSSRGARQTQDIVAPRLTQGSQAPRKTRASTQQVQAPRQTQDTQAPRLTQAS